MTIQNMVASFVSHSLRPIEKPNPIAECIRLDECYHHDDLNVRLTANSPSFIRVRGIS